MSVIPIQPGQQQYAEAQQGPPVLPDGTVEENPAVGLNAALRAFRIAAENIAGEKSSEEAKDWAQAALNVAQAIVVLDPSLSQGGTPLAHDLALKAMEGDTQQKVAAIQGQTQVQVEHVRGQHALRQANEAAKAPSPVKTSVAQPPS